MRVRLAGMVHPDAMDGAIIGPGGLLFNRDELDESTVTSWAAGLQRILASAVRDPDQDWKTL